MVKLEKIKLIDISKIQEPDLDLNSTRSGWFTIRYGTTLFSQICLRPDNSRGFRYLKEMGIATEDDLLNEGRLFLVRSDVYLPKSTAQMEGIIPPGYMAPLVPASPLCLLDITGWWPLVAGHRQNRSNLKLVN